MKLPDLFFDRIAAQIGTDEARLLLKAIERPSPVSVRINPIKNNCISGNFQVPWCKYGYYLDERPAFTLDPDFHAGAYYVQEASSMVLWHILETIAPGGNISVLDLCAAPGGKSTLAAAWLSGKGMLVANEVVKTRANVLKYNILKEGHANVIITCVQPSELGRSGPTFDIVIVDAPCSGEGMFRKDPEAVSHWSVQNVETCAVRQKSIIADILPALKEGGFLIYSTCTYNHEENINNADYFASEFGMEGRHIPLDESWGISVIEGKKTTGYQFFPHRVRGEGFFVTVLQKTEVNGTKGFGSKPKTSGISTLPPKSMECLKPWLKNEGMVVFEGSDGLIHVIPEAMLTQVDSMFKAKVYMLGAGITAGKLTKDVFTPDHSLALSHSMSTLLPRVELDKTEALLYLKKQLNTIRSGTKGWTIASYNGNALGFLKNLGDRINNYLPNEYRILMDLPTDITAL